MNNALSVLRTEAQDHVDEHAHGEFSIDGLVEVMFGLDHVISEVFWNVVFLLIGYGVSRVFAWRKIHKYIDEKHGVKHQKDEY